MIFGTPLKPLKHGKECKRFLLLKRYYDFKHEESIGKDSLTVEEYQQDLASGLRKDEVLQPGRHTFKRHALQGEGAVSKKDRKPQRATIQDDSREARTNWLLGPYGLSLCVELNNFPAQRRFDMAKRRSKFDLKGFMDYMAQQTREVGYDVEGYIGTALLVTIRGRPQTLQLGSLYEGYAKDPRRLDVILDSHHQLLRLFPPCQLSPTDRKLQDSLLPMIQSQSWLERQTPVVLKSFGASPPIHYSLVDDLYVVYAIDTPYVRMYLNDHLFKDMQRVFGMTRESLHEISLKNLQRRTSRASTLRRGKGILTFLGCNTGDGHSAARILLPKFMRRWQRFVPGRLIIGLPSRDVMIGFSEDGPAIEEMAKQIYTDYQGYQNKLSPKLFVWEDRELKLYEEQFI